MKLPPCCRARLLAVARNLEREAREADKQARRCPNSPDLIMQLVEPRYASRAHDLREQARIVGRAHDLREQARIVRRMLR